MVVSISLRNVATVCPAYLEEKSDNKHLQCSHANDQTTLDHAKSDDTAFGAMYSREVTVLTRAEVLLVSRDAGQLTRDLVDRLFDDAGMLVAGTLLGRKLGTSLVLDLFRRKMLASRSKSKRGTEPFVPVLTEISKSTNFSANVLIWLLKQKEYSPGFWAVKAKSPCRSFSPSRIILPPGPSTM